MKDRSALFCMACGGIGTLLAAAFVTSTSAQNEGAVFDGGKTRTAFFVDEAPTIDGVIEDAEWARAEGAGLWWRLAVDDNTEDGLRGGEVASGDLPLDHADEAWFAKTELRPDGDGYEAEFKIKLETIGSPKPGDVVGFSVAINDDDEVTGNREAQLNWSGRPHSEFTYGFLTLSSQLGSGGAGLPALRFTDVQFDPAGRNVMLKWKSRNGRTYAIERSFDLQNWEELDDGIEPDGEITSAEDSTIPADVLQAYYRILETQ